MIICTLCFDHGKRSSTMAEQLLAAGIMFVGAQIGRSA